VYIIVNKTSFSLSTLKLTNSFISEALSSGGRILVHGCDGLDQSAAVITSALMSSYSVSLEVNGFIQSINFKYFHNLLISEKDYHCNF